MAPVQQTFSVIPELPKALANGSDTANARSSKPPMTTKQAKKLYKAATKVPKLSKAEQRRQDLMEQDRIRREFEKERNQARAKTARDKKKEKEEKEKADKKRKGLPLKEVHPSQDTLARFMRPLKPPKKVEEDPKPPPSLSPPAPPHSSPDDESDDTSPIGDVHADDDDDRPVKRQKLEEPIEQAVDAVPCDQSPSASPKVEAQEEAAPELPAVEVEKVEKESPTAKPSDRAPDDMKTEDQIGKCNASESFSADDGLDDEDFSALFIDVAPDPEPGPVKASELRQNQLLPEPRDPSEPPEPAPRSEEHVHPPADTRDAIDFRDSIGSRSQLPKVDVPPRETQKADKDALDTPTTIESEGLAEPTVDLGTRGSASRSAPRSHTSSCPSMDSGSKTAHSNLAADVGSNTKRPLSAGVSSRQAPVARRESSPVPQTTRQPLNTLPNAKAANLTTTAKMAPPPLPPRVQTSRVESSGLAGSRPRLSPGAATNVMTNNYTPTRDKPANEHMPPSSTQLFLFDNLDDLFPSPSQEVQEIFEKPRVARNRTETRQQPYPPPRLNSSATVAKMRNSPVTPQLSSIRQPMRRPFTAARMVSSKSPAKPKHIDVLRAPLQSHDQCNTSDGDFPFLSTQDFFMSSQDIRELEDDTSSPIKPSKPPGQIDCHQPTSKTSSPKHYGSSAAINNSDSQATGSGVVPHVQTPDLDRQAATGVQAQLTHPFKAPMDSSSQASSLPDTPSLPRRNTRAPQSRFMHPRAAPRSSANGVAPDEQRSSCSNPFRFKSAGNGTPRPSPGFQSAKTVAVTEPIEAAPSQTRETPPRPSPKPFFTSSGTRELTFLAIERSKRTAREDLHARRKADEELAKQEKSKRPRETTHNEPKVPTRESRLPSDHDIIDNDDDDYELDEILLASDLVKDPVSNRNAEPLANNTAKRESNQTKSQHRKNPDAARPVQNRARDPDGKKPESAVQSKPKSLSSYEKMLELAARQRNGPDQGGKRIESRSEESDKENREQDIPPNSQGTDYGDATWDMTDLDLDFL